MRTQSLRDLQRACRRALRAAQAGPGAAALLVAPLLISCSPQPSGPTNGTHTAPPDPTTTGPSSATASVATSAATTSAHADCKVSAPDITGCGGAEVKLESSLASCDLPETGEIPAERCAELCRGFEARGCHVYQNREGRPGVFCDAANPCMGRPTSRASRPRPPVAHPSGGRSRGDAVARYLAFAERMESISVDAFRELESDLARWGAPASLLTACRRAAADEARHANAMRRLLLRRGATPRSVAPRPAAGFPSLEALALHNEREGVVGETVGAVVAAHQAEHAADRAARTAMRAVAREELEHAALSFRIASWARRKLGPRVASELDAERRRAFERARHTRAPVATPTAAAELGWPSPPATQALVDSLAPVFGLA